MKINKRLHLVIPVEGSDGTFYVHAAAISKATFEEFFFVLARAFAELYNNGLSFTVGPRVAALELRKIAKELQANDPTSDVEKRVEQQLIGEIKRLANVLVADPKGGWQMLTLHDAQRMEMIDEEDMSEIENALCFFSCASSMHRKTDREAILTSAAKIWGGQTSYLDCTAFKASLPTSTPEESSGKEKPSPTVTVHGDLVEMMAESSVPC